MQIMENESIFFIYIHFKVGLMSTESVCHFYQTQSPCKLLNDAETSLASAGTTLAKMCFNSWNN